MQIYISTNKIPLGKLLKKYKLNSIVKQGIIKEAQKRYLTCLSLNRIAEKIYFKESS